MSHFKARRRRSAALKSVRRILAIVSVLSIALISYSVTVYAWFRDSIANSGNTIHAGEFSARIDVLDRDGSVLWTSGAGIHAFDGAVRLKGGGAAHTLRVTGDGTLPFQYQLELEADGKRVELVYQSGAAPKSRSGNRLLRPEDTHAYRLTLPANFSEITLLFRTAFQHSKLDPLPTAVRATASVTLPGSTRTAAGAPPTREATAAPAAATSGTAATRGTDGGSISCPGASAHTTQTVPLETRTRPESTGGPSARTTGTSAAPVSESP